MEGGDGRNPPVGQQRGPNFYQSIQPRFAPPNPSAYGYPVSGYNSPHRRTRYRPPSNNDYNNDRGRRWNPTGTSHRSNTMIGGSPRPPIYNNVTLDEGRKIWEHRTNNTKFRQYDGDKRKMLSPTFVNHNTGFPLVSTGDVGTNATSFQHPSESVPGSRSPVPPVNDNCSPMSSHYNQQRSPPPIPPLFHPICYQPPFILPELMKELTCLPAPIIPGFPYPHLVPGMNPFIAASMWSVHFTPEGTKYYYNFSTNVSVWEKPLELTQFESMTIAVSNSLDPSLVSTEDQLHENISKEEDVEQEKCHEETKEEKDKPKPIVSRNIASSVWCLVGTNDKRLFFYNVSSKTSEWEIPPELSSRPDVYQMVEDMRREIENMCNEAKLSNVVSDGSNLYISDNYIELQDECKDLGATKLVTSSEIGSKKKKPKSSRRRHLKNKNGTVKGKSEKSETIDASLQSKPKEEESSEGSSTAVKKEDHSNMETETNSKLLSLQDIVSLKGIDIETAERIAAKERANVSLEERKERFHELLKEKSVSAFSTWEKELQKIVFDPRYLLLTSKERKFAFQLYVKDRAGDEARENQARLMTARAEFVKFVDKLLDKDNDLTYAIFERKHAKDSRMDLIEKPVDRKNVFMERLMECREAIKKAETLRNRRKPGNNSSNTTKKRTTKEKIDDKLDVKRATMNFQKFLLKTVTSHHYNWKHVYNDFGLRDDRRFLKLEIPEMKELFRSHRHNLKRQAKEVKDTKTKSKESNSDKCQDSPRRRICQSSISTPQLADTVYKKSDGEVSTDSE